MSVPRACLNALPRSTAASFRSVFPPFRPSVSRSFRSTVPTKTFSPLAGCFSSRGASFVSSSPSSVRYASSSPIRPKPLPEMSQEELRAAHSRMVKQTQEKYYEEKTRRSKSLALYGTAVFIVMIGASYAAVPIYRAFCGATGFAGIPMTQPSRMQADRLLPTSSDRRIKVHFNAAKSDILPWEFKPAQSEVTVRPGETALAFYTAKNLTDQDVIGISTYNVTPGKIAPYFAKVECFCFEEQRIRANEEVDLPVFFFLDRDLLDDPKMDDVDDVVLNYTFFKARRNDRGHIVPDASLEVVEAASGFAEFELANPHGLGTNGEGVKPSASWSKL